MDAKWISQALWFCLLGNVFFLAVWGLIILFCRGWIHPLASRWLQIPEEQLNVIQFNGIVLYKAGFLLFNLVPYLAVRFAM